MNPIRIGTRGSQLALAQSTWVKKRLEAHDPEQKVELIVIKTSGDRFVDRAVAVIGGKGAFVKEIEDALLNNEIDLAVHSMKDLPTELPPGLTIAAVPEREDPRDVLVSRGGMAFKDLPGGAKIGTGSLRRRAQILVFRPDLAIAPIRGNVDTRIKKLDAGEVDAVVLAAAGLKRIGIEQRITEYLSPEVCLSAGGQGALALEAREGDAIAAKLAFLHHAQTHYEVLAERSFLDKLGGGCQVPIGVRAGLDDSDTLRLTAIVAAPDGSKAYRGEITGPAARATVLGDELAKRLLEQGAGTVLSKG